MSRRDDRKGSKLQGKVFRCKDVIEKSGHFSYCKTLEEAKIVINSMIDNLIWLYENYYAPYYDDWHNSEECYGFGDNEERILGELRYISDRWKCAARIRLMIDLVRTDYVPKNRKFDLWPKYEFKPPIKK